MPSTADTPRARQLGAELRAARKAAGLSTSELGTRLGRSHTHVSRWENGKLTPREADVGAVLGILGVTGDERERLLQLARDAGDPNWVAPGVGKQLTVLTEYERTAQRITDVEPLLIPGLLQTGNYARSIMRGAGATRGEADKRVTYRLGRRDVLSRRTPVALNAIIGEHALRYPPCEPAVMVEQLRHLSEWVQRDNVEAQVLPLGGGYSPALEGPFVLIEFSRDKPVVHLEHYRSSTTITDAKDVQDYQNAAERLRGMAMSREASAALVAEITDQMEKEK
ncbi:MULTISPECIES: helix-turn-helix transcriptional regulator [unclassified Saccharopolyspora]|uniref:helix-turn-helix domain-containing protein n=1 Tax=unclassified Saccharopolyspora TaxID=2646250 RepID=UPI001CD594C6|nr:MULTISPECIES: helix-turn-helix transcriptional regulator [unclassified Saccharopolyspora]MCA1185543.1 helix-turn-helix domain-containing protein [Saccharopolyspora sp. 6T]MCA1196014.1 helix-turn-helix domain-containing protein [Saccharopolyspora sp. 6V]MCA1283064.1 helix-turn-helix domain-containing protein [Saccharopolyspora sp. 7B]